ncbi:type II toxin-antitoxin system VapC family toxin [Phreatobacter sp. HK31-P]
MSKSRSTAPADSTRIVINDTSCLIDLHKVGLVSLMLRLPYEFQVALPVREKELLTISTAEWASFTGSGLLVVDLDPNAVTEAFRMRELHVALSAEDCFSLVLARNTRGALLLTSDGRLRAISESYKVEVHGILWVLDELLRHDFCDGPTARACLEAWRDDPLVWLPTAELTARLKRFGH